MQQQRGNRRFPPRKREPEHRINERIRALEVRLVGDNIPEIGIYTTPKAIEMAQEQGLDLVEIASTANPPVCRIMDYSKFLYDKKKKEKEIKAKTAKTVLKEIRFTSNTDDHDFDFKVKHAEKFLKEGAKVKAYVQFRGRAIMFKERGEIILLKLAKQLEELGSPEALPKLEGKRMIMFINPKPQKAGAKKG